MTRKLKAFWHSELDNRRERFSDNWSHCLGIYDHVSAPWYGKPVNFLEIDVQGGGSLEIARRLFGEGP